ncbi:hypothetical protein E2C01_091432 [Portunus trituberculatus]|uniref:Uncharacterized protein n=1 Tax=Portunus trituberculatus TaxID=210409 RepID=A0A5B7JHH3_PORTR|nr:hypothetical protein [Portunus trituberculatus]
MLLDPLTASARLVVIDSKGKPARGLSVYRRFVLPR